MTTPLPNGDEAIIDFRKLADYCLSPIHPRGRHKARVFRDALNLEAGDAPELCRRILDGVREKVAEELPGDMWGSRWQVDIAVERQGRRAVVRTLWIVRVGERAPRFITCWVI